MCSFLSYNFDVTEKLEHLNFFTQKRGPDNTTTYKRDNHLFAHNLLSITGDFTKQPFYDERCVVLFNGEIYNYKDFNPEAKSDGEIIIPCFYKYGKSFFNKLDGEFAIVIYDYEEKEVLVATDTFSTKPVWVGKSFENNKYSICSYKSAIERSGISNCFKVPANSLLVFDIDSLNLKNKFKIKKFDLNQYKEDYDDCIKAFEQSIKKRTQNVREKIFIGLSSGYDSGAIACELINQNVDFKAYTISAEENKKIIDKRHEQLILNNKIVQNIDLTRQQFIDAKSLLKQRAEEHQYKIKRGGVITPNEFMTNDKGSVGLTFICNQASKDGYKIYLSGQGADEIFSDYGFNGNKIYSHSTFGGLFPKNLKDVFPWNSFYDSTQYSYLGKEENVPGAFGIEGRYPFLDYDLVQEFLWLKPDLKNKFYKSILCEFMIKNDFPFDYNKKIGFSCDRNLK